MLGVWMAALSLWIPGRLADDPALLPPVELTTVVAAPRKAVWDAMTTSKGLESWEVAMADVELRNGAIWRTRYAKGALGDDGTIFNELMAFDPGRMIAQRIQKPPKGFPFMNVYKEMWTVIYLDPVDAGHTRVVCRTLGLRDSEEGRKMQAFFQRGNQYTLDQLVKHFEKPGDR